MRLLWRNSVVLPQQAVRETRTLLDPYGEGSVLPGRNSSAPAGTTPYSVRHPQSPTTTHQK